MREKIKNVVRRMAIVMDGWSCGHCGTWNSDGASACQGCGKS
ncbi:MULTISPECIES: hypothetical protein [Nocardiopsis]|nr:MULTISPECIES: hypothetical protein [Nocardiopsis]